MQPNQEDKNQYLDYSYTKFENNSRSRTNSQQLHSQPTQFTQNNLNSSFQRHQQTTSQGFFQQQTPIASPMNMMGGAIDMMSFMQQMQQMQQMMNQFNMMQMQQQMGNNSSVGIAQPAPIKSQIPNTNSFLQKKDFQNQSQTLQNSHVSLKEYPRREFRQERDVVVKGNTKIQNLNDYLPTHKSEEVPYASLELGRKQLDNYIMDNKKTQQTSNRKLQKPFQSKEFQSTYDLPSSKNTTPSLNFDQIPIVTKSSSKFNFDDMPIKSAPQNQFKSKPNRASKKNMYSQFQEKPVKGLGKNFDQVLDQELQFNKVNDRQADRRDNPSIPKNFLKKGTRQFLSNARSKVKGDVKEDDEYLQKSRQLPPTKSKKVEISSKATPKNKNDYLQSSRRLKIQTDETDQPLFRVNQDKSRNKSPKPMRQIVAPKPHHKKQSSLSSSVQQINDQQKVQLVRGVIVTLSQFQQIKQRYMMENDSMRDQMQRMRTLKSKYEQMNKILTKQRAELFEELQREKEAFEEYKEEQMKKINNQKRVAERQKQAVCNVSYKKQKQELQVQKKQWEKQKDEMKKKEASSKHYIQKLKKQVEELKRQASIRDSQTISNRRNTMMTQKQTSKDKKQIEKNKPKFTYKDKDKSLDDMSDRGKKIGKNTSFNISKDTASKPKKDQLSVYSSQGQTLTNQYNYDDLRVGSHTSNLKKNIKNTQSSHLIKQQPSVMQKSKAYGYEQQYRKEESDESEQEQKQEDEDYEVYNQGMTIQDLGQMSLNIKMVTDQMIEDLFHYYTNDHYVQYQRQKKKTKSIKSVQSDDPGKTTTLYADGSKQIFFENGVKKQIFPSGYSIIHFKNKDVKQKLPDGTTLYFFKQKNVDQITFGNNSNIFRFQNNQVEFHHPDGLIEIRHADGTIKSHRN